MNTFRATLSAVSLLAASLIPAKDASADSMTWRIATVVATQQGGGTIRRGVAMMDSGQPAFVTLRLRPTAPPSQGAMPFATETEYRFEDGSSFIVRGEGIAKMSPEGVPVQGETEISGTFIAGTGRYAGISGTVLMRSVSGMNRMADGVLGDQFAEGRAEYTLPK